VPVPENRYSNVPERPSTVQTQTPEPRRFAEPSLWMTIVPSSVVVPVYVPVRVAVRLTVRNVLPPAVLVLVVTALRSENSPLDGIGGLAEAGTAAKPTAIPVSETSSATRRSGARSTRSSAT
jgi:hypothetical protein